MDINNIQYRLIFANGDEETLELHLRQDSLTPVGWQPSKPPEWAALEFHQCSNCPLKPQQSPYCPAALNFSKLVDSCKDLDLLDTVKLEVKSSERLVSLSTTVQKAIGSFIGLLMAASDCPHTKPFRPLARFHLPLASEAETLYRALAGYLLGQYFKQQSGGEARFDLQGLHEIYGELETVNTALANRLKASAHPGARELAKTFMEWDVFSGMFPMRSEELLKELRPLFAAYLEK